MKKRIFSMLLVLCLIFSLMPVTAFAEVGANMIGTNNQQDSGRCPHTKHDYACSYIEAIEGETCAHLEEDGSYSCLLSEDGDEATSSNAKYVCGHDDDCGFIEAVEGNDCTHECKLCKPSEEEIPAPKCDCTVRCTAADKEKSVEASIKADCPVCSIENYDLTACKGKEAEAMQAASLSDNIDVATIQELNNALKTTGGATITLTADMKGSAKILRDNTFDYTIDLNGKTLDGGEDIAITHQGSGTLTIAGTDGKITSNTVYFGTIYLDTSSDGNLVVDIQSGLIENTEQFSQVITGFGQNDITVSSGTVSGLSLVINWLYGEVNIKGTAKITTTGRGMAIQSIGKDINISDEAVVSSADFYAINYIGNEVLTVSDTAEVSSITGSAISKAGRGKVIIRDNAKISSASKEGTIALYGEDGAAPDLEITGGIVSATGEEGIAIHNSASGTVTVDGGMVKVTGGTDDGSTIGILNSSTGRIIVSSGTVSAISTGDGTWCFAIQNTSTGTVKINGTGELFCTDGGINNLSTGTIIVEGGQIISEDTGIYNWSSGNVDINGGKVASTGRGGSVIYNLGTGTVTVNDGIVSSISNGIDNSDGTINIKGGIVTSAEGIGIYNSSIEETASCILNISGGTVGGGPDKSAIYNRGAITVTGGNISAIDNKTGGTVKNDIGEDVYKVIFNEPAGQTGKKLVVTIPDYYDLTNSTAINSNWCVWLPLGTSTATYNDQTYTTTVKADGSGDFNPPPVLTTVTSTMNFIDVTSDVKCTDSDVADQVDGMTPHIHEGGTPCWTWNYREGGSTLTLNDFNLEVVSDSNVYGIRLPKQTVTVNWSGISNINVSASRESISITEGINSDRGSIIMEGTVPDAVLNITTQRWYSLFAMNGEVIINEGILNVTSGGFSAIASSRGIIVNGGTVTAVTTGDYHSITKPATLNGGTITAKAEPGITPFQMAPILSGDIGHDDTTSTWDNTTGAVCTYKILPSTVYTITFDANGGSVSPKTATTGKNHKLTDLPTPIRMNYRFDGWFTKAADGTQVTTDTVFTGNHTIYAHWTATSGSSSGGSSSGSSNVIITPPVPDKPNDPTQAEIKVETKVDERGTATVNVTDQNITDAISEAGEKARKNGDEANGISLVLTANTGNQAVNSVSINLPKTVQEKIISNHIVSTVVVVDHPNIKIGIDLIAMTEINKQANGDVFLTAVRLDSGALAGEAKTVIGNRPVFDIGVRFSGGTVTSFGNGRVAVSIPYTLQNGETPGNIYGVYADANGKAEWIANSSYDDTAKVLRLRTNHLSAYGVGCKQDAPALTDIAGHPAKKDIEFVAARGLLSGTEGSLDNSPAAFGPDTSITRAMFVTALGRLAEIDTNNYKTDSFTDVKADAYYAPYVNWAVSKGITAGTTATEFSPDQPVTRQEMAVFMANYAKVMGYTVPKTRTAVTFTDQGSIADWAKESVKSMQMAGVIMGKEGNRFDPTAIATKAQVSVVLRRYVDLGIDRNTAQGFDINDSGQWLYYQDGSPVKGWIQSDGKWYYMDASGLMKSGGWQQLSQKWYYFYADGSMAADTDVDGYFIGADGAMK